MERILQRFDKDSKFEQMMQVLLNDLTLVHNLLATVNEYIF